MTYLRDCTRRFLAPHRYALAAALGAGACLSACDEASPHHATGGRPHAALVPRSTESAEPGAVPSEPATQGPPRGSTHTTSSTEFVGSVFTEDELLQAMRVGRPRSFKPVGNTSVVFRVRFDGDLSVAWKPRLRDRPDGYRAEIAAYRVARLLGLDDVPPVLSRTFRDDRIAAKLEGDPARYAGERARVRWDDDGSAPGAAIYWIPQMQDLGIDRTTHPLAPLSLDTATPENARGVTRDLSNVVVFDYLIANWDRWSGGNLQGLPDGTRLFFRDHDRAFLEPLPAHVTERLDRTLSRVERFSRRTVRALRAIDTGSLEEELARDPEHAVRPLLDEAQLRSFFARRDAILRRVDDLVRAHGESMVFAFE